MDDESGEFMERVELTCVGRSESKMERLLLQTPKRKSYHC